MSEQEIFEAALEQDAELRVQYLEEACGADLELRQRIESLLRFHEGAGEFFEKPAFEIVAPLDQSITEKPGTQIGPYKLLKQIGDGGMGVVYMAEQKEPVKRRVALKIIKPGMDTRQVIARFEAERQALAMMDHPNIARVLDAGQTESGRPYFVMELVNGLPVTRYCDERHLTPKERLELFVPICRGVQHAHQKGIIHRDLKPSNILVANCEGGSVPKIIDFGVAKATSQSLIEKSMLTQSGQLVGTLEYMSPEQAEWNQLDIDTRSDIYSLGVVLYELLAGEPPFDRERLKLAGFDEIRRIIRNVDPPRPSIRVSKLKPERPSASANQRRKSSRALSRQLSGELDWIVMRAMEKDRSRRYESAHGLAQDILRYLRGDPVTACPPSIAYRCRKFAHRHRVALVISFCGIMTLLVTAVSVTRHVRDRQAKQAALEAEVRRAVDESLAAQNRGEWRRATSSARLARSLLALGGVHPRLRSQVLVRNADIDLIAALETNRLAWGSIQPTVGFDVAASPSGLFVDETVVDVGYRRTFARYGINLDAVDVPHASSWLRGRTVTGELVTALDHWALVRLKLGDVAGATRLLSISEATDANSWRNRLRGAAAKAELDTVELQALAESVRLEEHSPAALVHLAELLDTAGSTDKAVMYLRRVQRAAPGDFWVNERLGRFYHGLGDFDQSIRFLSAAIALRPRSPGLHALLGYVFTNHRDFDEGVAACREAVRINPASATAHFYLGWALSRKKEPHSLPPSIRRSTPELKEAEVALRESIRLDPESWSAYGELGGLLSAQERFNEAEDVLRQAIALNPDDDWLHYRLGYVLAHGQHRWEESIPVLEKAISLDAQYVWSYAELARALQKLERWSDAREVALRALKRLPPEQTGPIHAQLGRELEAKGDIEGATAAYREALRLSHHTSYAFSEFGQRMSRLGKFDEAAEALREACRRDPQTPQWHLALAQILLWKLQQSSEAEAAFRVALDLNPRLAEAACGLGHALVRQKRYGEAEHAWRQAIRLEPDNAATHMQLGHCLVGTEKYTEAAHSFRKSISLEPDCAAAHHALGDVLSWHLDRPQEAHVAYERASELYREDARLVLAAECHRRIGDILAQQRQPAESWEAYRRALRLNPQLAEVADKLRHFGELKQATGSSPSHVR